MTTIIMISQDSSVIIGPEEDTKESKEGSVDVESKSPLGGVPSSLGGVPNPLGKVSKEPPNKKRESSHQRRYKNSLSTVESDESELQESNSSSAASTLSSAGGNSLGLELPTKTDGNTGGSGSSSRGTTANSADSAFLSGEDSEDRVARARMAKPQRRSLPRTLSFSSGSSSSIFITSTTPSTASKDDSVLLESSKEVREEEPRLRGGKATPVVPGKTYSSPANGPHGIKFYINAATGRADLKASPGLVTRSLGRIVEAPTLSLPQEQVLAGNSNVESYCTTKRKGRRKLPSTFSIYSDIDDLQSLLRRQRNIQSQNESNLLQNLTEEESSEEDGWNAADVCADIICTTDDDDEAESSSDLTSSSSPLAAELASCCSSSSSSGKVVMPSGAHKHPHNSPSLRMRNRHEEDEYLDSLLNEDNEDSSGRSSSSFEVTRPPRLLLVEEEEGEPKSLAGNSKLRGKGKFSYSAMSLTNIKLRRRHTTYVKSTSNVAEELSANDTGHNWSHRVTTGHKEKESSAPPRMLPKHVHSWHRKGGRCKKETGGKKRMSMLWNSKVRTTHNYVVLTQLTLNSDVIIPYRCTCMFHATFFLTMDCNV